MMDVREAMQVGEASYATQLGELRRAGFAASFTQTGGMCAALEIVLERGYLLVTNSEDELPWSPEELRGWGVGYYECEDVSEGPVVFVETPRTDARALVASVVACLRERADVSRLKS
ncbi:hypothetical protein GCM10023200_52070 [Actinomycetospora chlora]|uniref:Uncharacterized protein n=1 Tax=Actinomycetospora chlora TaxID=663608 RepID=A0ABP9CFC6_9PSEU